MSNAEKALFTDFAVTIDVFGTKRGGVKEKLFEATKLECNVKEEVEDDCASDEETECGNDEKYGVFEAGENEISCNQEPQKSYIDECDVYIKWGKDRQVTHYYVCCETCEEFCESFCCKCRMMTYTLDNSIRRDTKEGSGPRTILPTNLLEIRTSPSSANRIFALETIPEGTTFGPCTGLVHVQQAHGCAWKLKGSKFVNAESAQSSNWMQFINCAKDATDQNLTIFQCESHLYYRTKRQINKGEELVAYHSEEYAKNYDSEIESFYYPVLEKRIENLFACTFWYLGFSSNSHLVKHRTQCPLSTISNSVEEIVKCPFCKKYLQEEQYLGFHMMHCIENYARTCVSSMIGNQSGISENFDEAEDRCSRKFHPNGDSGNGPDDKEIFLQHGQLRTSKIHCDFKSDHEGTIRKDMGNKSSTVAKRYVCNICKKSFGYHSNLKGHERTHTGEKPYECNVCKRSFAMQQNLKKHTRTHTGDKPYVCAICKKSFTDPSSLKYHTRLHTGEKYDCSFCKKSFTDPSSVKAHVRIHTGEKPFECDVCKKSFTQPQHLKEHMRTHTGEKAYECDVCKTSFRHQSVLKRHLRIHTGDKPYECNVCKKSYVQSSNLKNHMHIHTGEKPYECDVCKESFTQKSSLKSHMRIHTGEKPYGCNVCKKTFTHPSSVKEHMRIHTGEKPFECNVCKTSFRHRAAFALHVRIHTGEKPYECNVCKRSFRHRSVLQGHLRSHTGEKSYECDICTKSFMHPSTLKAHVRLHSGNKPKHSA